MNYSFLSHIKLIAFLSSIIGAILGFITIVPIPLFQFCVIFTLYWLIGGLVVYWLRKNDLVQFIELQDGALVGGVSGFIGAIAACLVYFVITSFLGLFISVFSVTFPIFLMIVISIFFAFISALMSAFSGLCVIAVYNFLDRKHATEDSFRMDYDNLNSQTQNDN